MNKWHAYVEMIIKLIEKAREREREKNLRRMEGKQQFM